MDFYTMPDSAFKADKETTEKELSELKKRVQLLEEAVRIIGQNMPLTVGGRR